MTGPEDSQAGTRPISVAELLAKNGTIGAPPVGGRRRRRRGNADAVTVAELTGEIPVITDDDVPAEADEEAKAPEPPKPAPPPRTPPARAATPARAPEPAVADPVEPPEPPESVEVRGNGSNATATRDVEADYEAHLQAREVDPEPVEFKPRRPQYPSALRDYRPSGTGAERMSPDPLDLDDDDDSPVAESTDTDTDDSDDRPYGGSIGPLFGGQSVADDVARRGGRPGPEDIDLGDDDDLADEDARVGSDDETDLDDERHAEESGSPLVRGAWVVAQCVIAVAFGAGLFIAFDQLWKWNSIVALVLGVIVILGLVVGVRIVRKTEDIGSTLTAVAVGALVTFGPLALLQAN